MPHIQRLNSRPQNLSCMTPKVKMFVHFREISNIPYCLLATDDIMWVCYIPTSSFIRLIINLFHTQVVHLNCI